MIKLSAAKENSNFLIVYCSVVPHDFPPHYRLDYVQELSNYSQVIFIDLPGGFRLQPLNRALGFYFRLIGSIFKFDFSFVWDFFRFKRIHFFILFLFLLAQRVFAKKKIILYPTSGYYDPVYRYIPYHKRIFDCPDIHKGELERNKLWINKFDLVFTNTQLLFKRVKKYNKNIKMVSSGYRKAKTLEFSKQKIPNSVLFLGGISQRIDYVLLERVIRQLPRMEFYFIGEVYLSKYYVESRDRLLLGKWKKLLDYSNVHHLGDFSEANLQFILPFFRIGIIPYETSDVFNYSSNPIKLYDYLGYGMYVISSPLPIVSSFERNYPVFIAETSEEFAERIKAVLGKPGNEIYKYERRIEKLLQKESMERKTLQVIREIKMLK